MLFRLENDLTKLLQTVSNLPTLTPTGTPITLSVPSSISGAHYTGSYVHDGWNNASYTASYYATPAGCSYPGPYDGVDADEPTAPCTGSPAAADRRRMLREAKPTPAPVPKF